MWINLVYSYDQSWIFSIIPPVFRVTWSSEIILIYWFDAQKHVTEFKMIVLFNNFVKTDTFYFSEFFDKNTVQKNYIRKFEI